MVVSDLVRVYAHQAEVSQAAAIDSAQAPGRRQMMVPPRLAAKDDWIDENGTLTAYLSANLPVEPFLISPSNASVT